MKISKKWLVSSLLVGIFVLQPLGVTAQETQKDQTKQLATEKHKKGHHKKQGHKKAHKKKHHKKKDK